MKILKNKGVVYNEKSCNLLQGNRYEYNKKDRKYGPVSNDTGFFDAFVLEDYEIDAKEIAKQIKLGPALSVKEDINYVNRYILNTTHIYGNRSSLEPLPELGITDSFRWKGGYKRIIIKAINERFNQYHKTSGDLGLILERRPSAVRRSKEDFIKKVISIDRGLKKLRKMTEALNDISTNAEKEVDDLLDFATKEYNKFDEWNKNSLGIPTSFYIEHPSNNYKKAKNNKILGTELVFEIVLPKPIIKLMSYVSADDDREYSDVGEIEVPPIQLQFRMNLFIYLQMLIKVREENLIPENDIRALGNTTVRSQYMNAYHKSLPLLDDLSYDTNYYVAKAGGLYAAGYMANSNPHENRRRGPLHPYINAQNAVKHVDYNGAERRVFRYRDRRSSPDEWDLESYGHSMMEICLGDIHNEINSKYLKFDFKGIVYAIMKDWNSYVIGQTHPLNSLRWVAMGIPKKWGVNAAPLIDLNTESCMHYLWSYISYSLPSNEDGDYPERRFSRPDEFGPIEEKTYKTELQIYSTALAQDSSEARKERLQLKLGRRLDIKHAFQDYCNSIECQMRNSCSFYKVVNKSINELYDEPETISIEPTPLSQSVYSQNIELGREQARRWILREMNNQEIEMQELVENDEVLDEEYFDHEEDDRY